MAARDIQKTRRSRVRARRSPETARTKMGVWTHPWWARPGTTWSKSMKMAIIIPKKRYFGAGLMARPRT